MTITQDIVDRLWGRIRVREDTGCLEWLGTADHHGYGQMSARALSGSRRMTRTHRLAWMMCFGAIPNGLGVLHHCDNPPCLNPAHLFLGTQADNGQDMARKGRHGARRHLHRWKRGEQHPMRANLQLAALAGRRSGLTRKARGSQRGERNVSAKLNPVAVAVIRALVAGGRRQLDLARAYGVSTRTVFRIVHHFTWN